MHGFTIKVNGFTRCLSLNMADTYRLLYLSRAQRKYMIFKWSDYYLERVGFEINMKMRRNLKYGNNLVGRSDINDDISICIDSAECSRKHCIITVADDESVSLTDLNVRFCCGFKIDFPENIRPNCVILSSHRTVPQ